MIAMSDRIGLARCRLWRVNAPSPTLPIRSVDEGRIFVKKLFKLLSLIRLIQDLRRGRRGGGHYGSHYGGHYGGYPPQHRYGHDYHPLHYGRPRKPKLKHIVRDLLSSRRY
jgi:hypothetical protein